MPPARDHPRPYLDEPPLALAHRGGATYGPNVGIENSLRAFRTAVDLGYRYVETDVHATADGELVAFHDDRLERVTDGSGRVAQLPWAAVARARIAGREPVPRLADLLEELPTTRFNIDLKADGAVEPLWRTLRDHGAEARVCVASFSDRRLRAFRRLAGERVATTAGPRETAVVRFAPARLSALARLPAAVLQVPVVHRLGLVSVRLVTRSFVGRAHRLGKQVHVWTVDDPAEMVSLLDLGVDGLVTDRIDLLKQVLVDRGQWRQ
ncbi:MAG: glycerophosphodiester phosphodiesterase [Actinomycetota bacterium]|nr:glycerophosphodiester phosphodiesterase [Actinomycetota bacterium]